MKSEQKLDDHHCSVIERRRLEKELPDCDTQSQTPEERIKCRNSVKEYSRQREQACKYS